MDAMGTQTDIARAIRDGGGDYCMSLKKNWPAVYADVEQLFNDPPDDVAFETHETADLTGGRIETRRHTVCHKVDWMTSDRHYPGEPVFPDLAMIGRIETEVERNGRIENRNHCCLCWLRALCSELDIPLHGEQEGRFFHGYYKEYLLPAALRVLRSAPAAGPPAACGRRGL